ncbi:MAG: hypothetical protein CUN54_06100, partial [Phototrophicales bacterium]
TRHVKMLITSRERINFQNEHVHEVKGLAVPKPTATDNLEDYASVQLFVQIAQRYNKDFLPTTQDLAHIAQIARFVEGIPLALIMAASWIRVHACEEIVAKLDELMKIHLRDFPDRHLSMNDVFDHSWDLLSNEEQEAFKRLAVFRGPFDLKAAQHVSGASDSIVLALRDKSLVSMNEKQRLMLYNLVRQYAYKKLCEDPKTHEQTVELYTGYYMKFLDTRRRDIEGQNAEKVLIEIQNEIENIREAWCYALENRDYYRIAIAAYTLNYYFFLRGLRQEGEEFFRHAVMQLRQAPVSQGRNHALAYTLMAHARQQKELMHIEEAQHDAEESLQFFSTLEPSDHYGTAFTRLLLAFLYMIQGRSEIAITIIEDTLDSFRTASNPGVIPAIGYTYLGQSAFEKGHYAEAKSLLETAVQETTYSRLQSGQLYVWTLLGITCLELNEYGEARKHFKSALALCKQLSIVLPFYWLVHGVALLCQRCNYTLDAAELLAVIAQHPLVDSRTRQRAHEQLNMLVKYSSQWEEVLTNARQQASGWIVNHQFGGPPLGIREEFLDYVLMKLEQTVGCGEGIQLTERELQVLRALVDYPDDTLTEIAQTFGIARVTVQTHIRNIGEKMGMTGDYKRKDVLNRAIQLGLLY